MFGVEIHTLVGVVNECYCRYSSLSLSVVVSVVIYYVGKLLSALLLSVFRIPIGTVYC